jgi:hypothetical protein
MFTLFYLLKGQNASLVLHNGKSVSGIISGSFGSSGANAWVIVDSKKIWCQAWNEVRVDSVDIKKLSTLIKSTSEKLEKAQKIFSAHAGTPVKSSYEKYFISAAAALKNVLPELVVILPDSSTPVFSAPNKLQ